MCLLVCRCATQMRCPPLSAAWRPGVQGCHKPLAKERQRALTPVRMADVHTTRQGGTWGHGTGQDWLVEAVPPGHGRKQTEAFLTWAAGYTHHDSTSHKLRATLQADRIDYKLIPALTDEAGCVHMCVFFSFSVFVKTERSCKPWSEAILVLTYSRERLCIMFKS